MNKSQIKKILKYSSNNDTKLILKRINQEIEESCFHLDINYLTKYVCIEEGLSLIDFKKYNKTHFRKSGIYFMPINDNNLQTVNKVSIDLYKYKSHDSSLTIIELRSLLRKLKRKSDCSLVKIYGLECLSVNQQYPNISRQALIIDQIKIIASEIFAVFIISWDECN